MKHFIKLTLISTTIFLLWLLMSWIGWTAVFAKDHVWVGRLFDLPLRFYAVPFGWVKPGSTLDGPILFLLPAIFWGCVLYGFFLLFSRWHRAQ